MQCCDVLATSYVRGLVVLCHTTFLPFQFFNNVCVCVCVWREHEHPMLDPANSVSAPFMICFHHVKWSFVDHHDGQEFKFIISKHIAIDLLHYRSRLLVVGRCPLL